MKPVHPILVPFSIALLSLSIAADLAGFFADVATLRDTGWWALLGAAVGWYNMRRATLSEAAHQCTTNSAFR